MGTITLKTAKRKTSVARVKIQAAVKDAYAKSADTVATVESSSKNGFFLPFDADTQLVRVVNQAMPKPKITRQLAKG